MGDKLFRTYANSENVMDDDGIAKFFEDIGLDMEDPTAFLVCYRMCAK